MAVSARKHSGRQHTERGALRRALAPTVLVLLVATQSDARPPNPIRVLLVGDSITVGGVGGDVDARPFAFVLQRMMGKKRFTILNAGCNGSTVIDWTDPNPLPPELCMLSGAFDSVAVPLLPADVMAVMLGSNDATGFFQGGCDRPLICPVSVEAYHEGLLLLVALARLHGVGLVVLSGPPPIVNASQAVWLRLEGYRIVTEQVCRGDERVFCTVSLLKLLGPSDYDHTDNVHPNAKGHRKIARAFTRAVRTALRRRGRR